MPAESEAKVCLSISDTGDPRNSSLRLSRGCVPQPFEHLAIIVIRREPEPYEHRGDVLAHCAGARDQLLEELLIAQLHDYNREHGALDSDLLVG